MGHETPYGLAVELSKQPVLKQPDIYRALEGLVLVCEDLELKINVLENRLRAVSRNSDPEESLNINPVQPFESEIAQTIAGKSNNIYHLVSRLTKIIERLEI